MPMEKLFSDNWLAMNKLGGGQRLVFSVKRHSCESYLTSLTQIMLILTLLGCSLSLLYFPQSYSSSIQILPRVQDCVIVAGCCDTLTRHETLPFAAALTH